ncbi:glycosyltransferase family 87 protein [Pseudolabrys sp. FHR47]|uniref:glycosyltransferase family 87 protein n=1 Tax=Pseudolabrys sp. FHR47 TaxID=2562284 RepID=UPI0010BEEDE7|nr:glycosyltransferase family 87 protein [Pseudolabrys sp. FHR47]
MTVSDSNEVASEVLARLPHAVLTRPVELFSMALLVVSLSYLLASYFNHLWLIGTDGKGIPDDFVNVWAAGRLVLQGHAPSVYDWPTHKAMEEVALGRPFEGYFGWHYPPNFLFLAAALALLPYLGAYLLWLAVTFPLYLTAIRAIIGERSGYLIGAAFPGVLFNTIVGQNGFLSAGLLGAGLVLIAERPTLAGLAFGLLTYKPQLGILIPIALIAGGYWRTIAAAATLTIAWSAVSLAAFGWPTWQGFIGNISHTSEAFLSKGWANFGKLQTAFGMIRSMDGSETLAWSVQGAIIAVAAIAIAALWRSRASHDVKAAGLGVAALLATPYLYAYDLAVLAVPLAFLFRRARQTGFLRYELATIGAACLLLLIFPFVVLPLGFIAILMIAGLVARRALDEVAIGAHRIHIALQ